MSILKEFIKIKVENKKVKDKKYEFTDETKVIEGKILRRIRAIKDFKDVKKGSLGGWIEKEENLSHNGNCWIYNEAMVYDNALVFSDAEIFGFAQVYGRAKVFGDAKIFDRAKIYDETKVCGNACVFGFAWVYGKAEVYCNARVCDNVQVYGNAKVYGDACIYDYASVYGDTKIHGDTRIYDYASIFDDAWVGGNARVYDCANVSGNAGIYGNAVVRGGARIEKTNHIISFTNVGSRNDTLTAFKTKTGIAVNTGCFFGDLEEFLKKVEETHENNKYAKEYNIIVEVIKNRFNEE